MTKANKTIDESDQAATGEPPAGTPLTAEERLANGLDAQAESAETIEAVAVDPVAGAATSAMAATGDVVHVPDSLEAVAAQATALGLANDHATGGYAPPTDTTNRQPVYTRVWAMDNDHTEKNRAGFDPVKPDCVTVQ